MRRRATRRENPLGWTEPCGFGAALFALSLLAASVSTLSCASHPPDRIICSATADVEACGAFRPGCTECVDTQTGGSCHTEGGSRCIPEAYNKQ